MTAPTLLTDIQSIMAEVFDDDELVITEQTTAADIEEWDSLSHIRLIVAIEREFGFKFANSEIENMSNVGDLLDAVAAKCNK